MMKKSILFLLGLALCLQAAAQIRFAPAPGIPLPENVKLYTDFAPDYDGHMAHMRPAWFIWTDGACTVAEAEALVDEMGLNDSLKDFVSVVAVISPVNGQTWDPEADLAVYKGLCNQLRVFVNLKAVGIGNGATFVNECIAPIASEIADIFCYGGKPAGKISGTSTVPAYLAGKDAAKAAKAYIARDKVELVEKGKTLQVYRSPSEPLMQVIVNTRPGSLRETLADAWERLLSVNYRLSNLGHTSYMGATLGQWGDYELEPYLMWERLGTERTLVQKEIFEYNKKKDKYVWYEYVPAAMKDAPAASVPLVILLHGHNNDPRTQAETSGFVDLAAQEGFMVAELEWQGRPDLGDYMGDAGIEAVVYDILSRHPQLDRTRIYAEGLSAGAFCATALGVTKSHLFAAVGAHSGGIFNGELALGFPFMDPHALSESARQKSGWVTMPYFSITGTVDDAVPFNDPSSSNGNMITGAWRLYQQLNGLPVSGPTDLAGWPIFGLPLENRQRIETNKGHAMETGDLLDKEGRPVIRIVAVENFGHWNFVPGTREMWNFFKHWSRDPETLQSVWHD